MLCYVISLSLHALGQMAPVGAAVVLTRFAIQTSVLFAVICVASAILSPVILFISSVHDVMGRPLPRLPSTEPCISPVHMTKVPQLPTVDRPTPLTVSCFQHPVM